MNYFMLVFYYIVRCFYNNCQLHNTLFMAKMEDTDNFLQIAKSMLCYIYNGNV